MSQSVIATIEIRCAPLLKDNKRERAERWPANEVAQRVGESRDGHLRGMDAYINSAFCPSKLALVDCTAPLLSVASCRTHHQTACIYSTITCMISVGSKLGLCFAIAFLRAVFCSRLPTSCIQKLRHAAFEHPSVWFISGR